MLGQGFAGVPSDAAVTSKQVRSNPRINRETVAALERDNFSADPGAFYHKELTLDLATVSPHVSGPNHVKVMKSVHEMQAKQVKINKAYLVSCVNSRYEDLSQAAEVVRGKKIAPHVKFYIAAAVRHHALLLFPLFPLGCNSHLFFSFFSFSSCHYSQAKSRQQPSHPGCGGRCLMPGRRPFPLGVAPVWDWARACWKMVRWEYRPRTGTSRGVWDPPRRRPTWPHPLWWPPRQWPG